MRDLSIMLEEDVKLNVRTTGVFTNNGKVLVHRCPGFDHYSLPGGRVQAREDSISALEREVKEELNLKTENTSFMAVIENFFETSECKFHEYMWMIKADFEDKTAYEKEYLLANEDGKDMIFEWLDINRLEEVNFKPRAAIPYIRNIDGKVHHTITRD